MTAKPRHSARESRSGEGRPPGRNNGMLFVVSAPSGAGKTTLCRKALARYPDLRYSVSYTTRPPRKGEKNGTDYYFISTEEFESGIHDHRWAEWARVHGHYYGTSADFIDRARANGHDVLLDIDVQGARQMLNRYPECVTIFVMPPSLNILRQRLAARATDAPETIERRMQAAQTEIGQKDIYRHVIVNDVLADAVDALIELIGDYRQNAET
jgi:guanylate kinase